MSEGEKFDINQLVSIQNDIDKIKKGEKTSVRRNDRYADKGDTLELDGEKFIIENVYKQKLGNLTEEDAKQEGYQDLDEYKGGITSIHHGSVWEPDMEVWVHEIKPA